MPLSRFTSRLLWIASILLSAPPGASASELISGVAVSNAKGSCTIVTKDPVYGKSPALLINTLKTLKYGSGYNIPSAQSKQKSLPNLGKFVELDIYYEALSSKPAINPGLLVTIQTSDGIIHDAVVQPKIKKVGSAYSAYELKTRASDYKPAFSSNKLGLKAVSVKYVGLEDSLFMLPPTYVYSGLSGLDSISFWADPRNFFLSTEPDRSFILSNGELHDWLLLTPGS